MPKKLFFSKHAPLNIFIYIIYNNTFMPLCQHFLSIIKYQYNIALHDAFQDFLTFDFAKLVAKNQNLRYNQNKPQRNKAFPAKGTKAPITYNSFE